MQYFKITLMRSGIGMPTRLRDTLKAMGLRKRKSTVFQPVCPDIAGKILKVKELLAVSEIESDLSSEALLKELKEARKPDKGYYIESRASYGPQAQSPWQ